MAEQPQRLVDAFRRYFEVRPAVTEADLEQALRLRHQVYCVENPFENPDEHPSGRETDAYDSHSCHALLIHRPTGQAMGTVRLVLPLPSAPEDSCAFQELCDDPSVFDPARLPVLRSAEVSRFCISKTFRRRPGDTYHGMTDPQHAEAPPPEVAERRIIPNMMIGLFQGMLKLSRANGITHWCNVMEPTLIRLLARTGIHFETVGSPVEYHGRRQPCIAEIAALLTRLREERRDIWEVITDDGALWDELESAKPSAADGSTERELQKAGVA